MKVTIKIEKTIENCYECPCKVYVYEQGYCDDCCKFGVYRSIPKRGIREDCPFIEQ